MPPTRSGDGSGARRARLAAPLTIGEVTVTIEPFRASASARIHDRSIVPSARMIRQLDTAGGCHAAFDTVPAGGGAPDLPRAVPGALAPAPAARRLPDARRRADRAVAARP